MNFLLDLLFPRKCLSCGQNSSYFCAHCQENFPSVEHQICPVCFQPSTDGSTHPQCQSSVSLDGFLFSFHYQGPIKKAIKKIKYRQVFSLTEELVLFALKNLDFSKFSDYLLVPIPLHKKRLRQRGFNQSEFIGKVLSYKLNLPLETDILKRIKNTPSQVSLNKKDRLENIKQAFKVTSLKKIKNQKILLIDDVFTSGATLKECAKLLKESGAQKVWAFTIAHGH